MKRIRYHLAYLLIIIVFFVFCIPACSSTDDSSNGNTDGDEENEIAENEQDSDSEEQAYHTALDDYIASPTDCFSCSLEPEKLVESGDGTASVFKMFSQSWLDASEVDRTVWEHWLTIFEPKNAHSTRAMLLIDGGSNRDGDAPDPDDTIKLVATMTDSIIASVGQVPNERLKFADESDERYIEEGRTEDELIAYAWDKYLTTSDPTWLPRLPMTKAAVKAMDIVQREYPNIEEFVIVGASKRGWTTWTTAAVDTRVIAIVPAVIDVLNVGLTLHNHYSSYGFWAPATHDYEDMGVLSQLDTPEFESLCEIVDPYSYLERYTMPKYIVNSTGDQFFPPDSWKFYYNDLPGENFLRYIPNTDHNLNMDAYFGLASFHHAILYDTPLPEYSWHIESDGNLVLECESEPSKVTLWQATNPNARDFRLEEIGSAFESSPLESEGNGVYRSNIQAPPEGWTAFVIEMEFPNPELQLPYKFSTGVSILPDTLPYADTPIP